MKFGKMLEKSRMRNRPRKAQSGYQDEKEIEGRPARQQEDDTESSVTMMMMMMMSITTILV